MYAPNSSLDHNMTKTLIMSQYLLVSKPSTSRDNFNFSLTLKLNKIAKWLWKIWSCVIFNKNQRIPGWDMWQNIAKRSDLFQKQNETIFCLDDLMWRHGSSLWTKKKGQIVFHKTVDNGSMNVILAHDKIKSLLCRALYFEVPLLRRSPCSCWNKICNGVE